MFHKRSWIVVLLLITALVFTACAAPAAPAADAPSEAAADDGSEMAEEGDGEMAMDWESVDPSGQEITFWYQHTRSREEQLQEIVTEFNETNFAE